MPTTTSARTDHGRPLRLVARLVGLVFVLVGVAGFVPGITTDHDMLHGAGNGSTAMLLGVFQTSVLHNLAHLGLGLLGLLMSVAAPVARAYLVLGGLVYALLAMYGLFVPSGSDWNFVPLNTADNWLHLGLAAGMVVLGVGLGHGPGKPVGAHD